MSSPKRDKDMSMCDTEPASPINTKISASPSLENLFSKPQFPFFPMLPAVAQPLNFSQHSARLATDLFNKFNNQLLLNQQHQSHGKDSHSPESDSNMAGMDDDVRMNKDTNNNNNSNSINSCNTNSNNRSKIRSELKKIDKIAENLRTTNKFFLDHQHQMQLPKSISSLLPQQLTAASPLLLKPPLAACTASMHNFLQPGLTPKDLGDMNIKSEMSCAMDSSSTGMNSEPSTPTSLMPKTDLLSNSNSSLNSNEATNLIMDKSGFSTNQVQHPASTPTPPGSSTANASGTGTGTTKAGNSKLFATCFICHKQLSNQYNLRVHLETHQNVRRVKTQW